MFSRVVNFDIISESSIWSAQYFLIPKENTSRSLFPLVRVREVTMERKETVNPQRSPYTDYKYLGLENIESNIRTIYLPNLKTGTDIKSTAKIFSVGDILYGKLRPNLNKVYLVDNSIPIGICSTEIIVLIPQRDILPEYLAEILMSDEVKQRAESLTRGASLPRIQVDDFLNIEIPLPDLTTQREMVDFIQQHRNKWLHYRSVVDNIPKHIQSSLFDKLYNDKPLLAYVTD